MKYETNTAARYGLAVVKIMEFFRSKDFNKELQSTKRYEFSKNVAHLLLKLAATGIKKKKNDKIESQSSATLLV